MANELIDLSREWKGFVLGLTEVRLDRAITELERAIELKPNYATAHHWLMFSHLTLGNFDPAIAEGKRALELDPELAEAHCAFACATLMWERDYELAARSNDLVL